MKKSSILKTLGLCAIAIALVGSISLLCCKKSEPLPNIVLIFTDDQGYADVGCYGAKGFETPNLDQMAAEGMRFTSFYVAQAVCSASRAALLTGSYSERVGIQGALFPWAVRGLNPEEETIAEMLKKEGYATGIFGKWHLGRQREFLPLQQGFDEYLGLPYSNDMWAIVYDGVLKDERKKELYPALPLIDGNEVVDEIETLEDQDTLTTRYTERAVQFIEENKDRPFFLYVPHSMVHVPLGVSEKYRGHSEQGMYGDVMMEIDWSVGEIVKTLGRHGLDDNTLVIFTSDNGPWLSFGNHGGSAFPLREGKGTAWEGGVRVPCIMRWPEHIPAGSVCDKLASTIDILPTLAAITGAPLPEKPIDGVNIFPLMRGETSANPRDNFRYYFGKELRAVRQGQWKLVLPHVSLSYQGVKTGKDGARGAYATSTHDFELYNLEEDVSETQNVIDQHPEIVARLKIFADEARAELGDSLTGVEGTMVREPGRISGQKEKHIQHLAVDKAIALGDLQIRGGRERGLIDGILGSPDYTDGTWRCLQGEDIEAVIDLGQVEQVIHISCNSVEFQGLQVFHPLAVEMAISIDGEKFETVGKIGTETSHLQGKITIKEHKLIFEPIQARYIRVKAINRKVCPDWHPDDGQKTWLCLDEIVVK